MMQACKALHEESVCKLIWSMFTIPCNAADRPNTGVLLLVTGEKIEFAHGASTCTALVSDVWILRTKGTTFHVQINELGPMINSFSWEDRWAGDSEICAACPTATKRAYEILEASLQDVDRSGTCVPCPKGRPLTMQLTIKSTKRLHAQGLSYVVLVVVES
jgi:hypothetical protein